ncbi:MAG: hypothetical protein IH596_12370 [Bacteroidales bacterium]|nr:hypothetical protein [Bacteroidales bacterium]
MVTYKDIYPGVDLEFLMDEELGFKYNFVIYPGGNVEDILISITGPEIEKTLSGSLLLKTNLCTIEEKIPHSYLRVNDSTSEINIKFRKLKDGIYGFLFENIASHNSTLIIDPMPDRVWGTYFGGSGNELFGGCATYQNGNVYICGSTSSSSNIATSGAYQVVYMGNRDAYLAKFNKDGEIQWATYYGGTSQDEGLSCSLSFLEDVYMCGLTYSETNISTPGCFQPVKQTLNDAFLSRFGPDGLLIWGTYYGGNLGDYGYDCCVDIDGNAYMAGNTYSTTNMVTPGAYQGILNGNSDAFLVKFNVNCERIWGTYYGGEENDQATCCSIDSIGHLFVGGHTNSLTEMASPAAHQTVFGGVVDGFLAGFTQDGQREWGTYYGGEGDDDIYDCTAALWGDLFIAGTTWSLINISTPGSFQTTLSGNTDGFVAKFNPEGTRIWGTYYGGSAGEWLNSCAIDDSVNLYLAGPTTSSGLATPGAFQLTLINGSQTCIVAKFDSTGQRKWATYYGGGGADHGWCDVDTSWNIYVCGLTASPTMLSTPGSYQPGFGGGTYDSFLARFSQCTVPGSAGVISGPDTVCKSANSVTFSVDPIPNASHYSWTVPPGAVITAGNETDSVDVWFGPASGSGNLSVYGYYYCGTGVSSDLYITVQDAPMLILDGPDTLCVNTQASYSTTSGIVEYFWNVSSGGTIISGGTTSDDTIVVNWNISGLQWIEVDATDISGCSAYDPPMMDVFVGATDTVEVTIVAETDTVCVGNSVTIIATPVHGGINPSFQWKVNGINSGANSSIFTYIPNDNDQVCCLLTSSESCVINNPVTSDTITMLVNPLAPVGITISVTSNPVCEGLPVMFTGIPVNEGSLPTYQWKVNGINAGTNNPIFFYTPVNGDIVQCTLTSNLACASENPATSNSVTMIVNPILSVSVSVTAFANPVCTGISVTFTAAPTNGGSSPSYQWQVNATNAGTNSPIFTYVPMPNDQITCMLTSSELCTSGNPASGNPVIMTVIEAPDVTFTPCFDTITTTNAKPIKLRGGIPLGGTYSGSGVSSESGGGGVLYYFNPTMAGVGIHQITYSYTNVAFCSGSQNLRIHVFPSSLMACGSWLDDIRDNQSYPTVQIGSQCWLAANLNYGTEIPYSTPQRDNCIPEKYTRPSSVVPRPSFYQWDELMCYSDIEETQGLCPPGWHVPSEADWNQLFSLYQGNAFAGSPLIYSGYSGFNAQLSGINAFNRSWYFEGFATFYWSSTSHGPWKAWAHGMNDYNYSVSYYPSYRGNGFSARCLLD